MSLPIKHKRILIVFMVLVLGTIVQIQGCGNNTANQNWKITPLNSTLAAPIVGGAFCYDSVKFLVTDPSGAAANGISLDISTGPLASNTITKHVGCAAAFSLPASPDLTLTTDPDGTVTLDFVVTPTATGQVFFIDVSSGAAVPAELDEIKMSHEFFARKFQQLQRSLLMRFERGPF
jgi:hypothetical protein